MSIKQIGAHVIVGLLLLILILPQVALAAGPEISNVYVPDITFATATITWTTNTTSDSRVNYGTDRSKNATWEHVHDATEVTHHSIHLEGLTPDETYYFEVVSKDASGTITDNNGGEYYSFKTLAWYSINLYPISGSYGEEITVTATVAAPGTYYICWESLNATACREKFKATAGSNTLTFDVPKAVKDSYTVYLADSTYNKKAEASFEIFPSVQIDPREGPVGTEVTVNGYGFTNSQDIIVTFFRGGVQKGEGKTDKADAEGTWGPISYPIPETPAGDYAFVVEVEEAAWVSKDFDVTPKITAPTSGAVGQTIEIKGMGFASEEEDIEVTFDEVVVKENIPADVNGSWTARINIPALEGGSYTIDASGESTRARDVPDIESFTVGAGIFVEPPGAHPVGDPITVKGGGFATRETGIRVMFEGQVVASGITAKEDGTWETSFDLPASAYGSHAVEASGDITKPAVTASLSIQARILEISPDEGVPGDLVSLTGDGFGSSEQLTVTIGGTPASESVVSQPNGNVAISFRVPKGSIEGARTVVVTGGSGATVTAPVDFMVKEKILATPQAVSPENNIKFRSGDITFRWGGTTGGSDVTYILQISNSPDVSTYVWSRSDIETSSYTLPEEEALPKGTYYWWVKAVDNYGNESPWSDSSSFRVSPIPIWVWVIVGVVVLVVLMVVAYRETKFKVTE